MFLVAFGHFLISRALPFFFWSGFYQCTTLPKAAQAYPLLSLFLRGSWLVCTRVSLRRLLRGERTAAEVCGRSVCHLQPSMTLSKCQKLSCPSEMNGKPSATSNLRWESGGLFPVSISLLTPLWSPSVSVSCVLRWGDQNWLKHSKYRRTTDLLSDIFSLLYPRTFCV